MSTLAYCPRLQLSVNASLYTAHRHLSVASRQKTLEARGQERLENSPFARLRILPKSPTFYSANPPHEDRITRLQGLWKKYGKLPSTLNGNKSPQWITMDDYAVIGGGNRLKPKQYQQLIYYLNKLNQIDPQLSNDEIKTELSHYVRKSTIALSEQKIPQLDEYGRSIAVGRRKSATAKVFVVRGTGEIIVNGRSLNDYFLKLKDRESIMYPLQVIDSVGRYNIFALTSGGGPTGQAEAIMHAVGKALVTFNPLLKSRLHNSKVLTRDYRHVERKKPGKKKARKMPTWVKR